MRNDEQKSFFNLIFLLSRIPYVLALYSLNATFRIIPVEPETKQQKEDVILFPLYYNVHKYLEYHCLSRRTSWDPPPPLPEPTGGDTHSPAVEGVHGVSQCGRLKKKPIALCLLCVQNFLYYLNERSAGEVG
jgi:hypothetical protein